jgi:hypothetical protein
MPVLPPVARVDELPAVPGAVAHLVDVHVELLGDKHHQAGRDAVADLDLARLEHRRVVGVDGDVRVDLRRVRQVARRGRGGGTRLAAETRSHDAEADDEGATALDERAARELLVEHLCHDYFPPFAITAAAFWIAVKIRG